MVRGDAGEIDDNGDYVFIGSSSPTETTIDADGNLLEPGKYIVAAEGSGLISTIDNNLLFRCVQLVRKSQRRELNFAFFCNISRYTLMDTSFFPEFIDFMERNAGLASSLIFEFTRADLATHDRGTETRHLHGVLTDSTRHVEHPPAWRSPCQRQCAIGHPLEQEVAVRRGPGRNDVAHVPIEIDHPHDGPR